MERLRVEEVVVVEGRYDAATLAGQIDGLIITTDGFGIFSDEEKKALLRRLGQQRGLLVLTDSDAAGFRIRNYVQKIAAGCEIKHAYIPAVPGKEGRKAAPSKEGTLGVEGMPPETLREALRRAGMQAAPPPAGQPVDATFLYQLGLSGTAGSATRRRALLQRLGLPPRLSKRALAAVLSSLYTRQELAALAEQSVADGTGKTGAGTVEVTETAAKTAPGGHGPAEEAAAGMPPSPGPAGPLAGSAPGRTTGPVPGRAGVPGTAAPRPVLFWDFHGTLTLPDITWFRVAAEAAEERAPHRPLEEKLLLKHLAGACLPWFTTPGRDTRHLAGSARWWAHTEKEFAAMYQRCGFTAREAAAMVPLVREKSLQPHRYALYPDAVPTLRELQRRGYRSYILSNNFPELPQLVQRLGLAPLFQAVLTSGEIGYDKPHPGIFAHARAMAAAGEAPLWMIGDNPADDLEGAAAAGFVPVAVHGVQSPAARHRVDQLAQLLDLLP